MTHSTSKMFYFHFLRFKMLTKTLKGTRRTRNKKNRTFLIDNYSSSLPRNEKRTIMGKEDIINVSIEDFKGSKNNMDYVDDDFVIKTTPEEVPHSNETIRLQCFLIVICVEGRAQLDINFKTYQLQAGELMLGLPNTIISHTMFSPQHQVRLAAFSTRFLQRIIKMEKNVWDTVAYINRNPIKFVGETSNQIFGFYRDLILAKINDEPHYYHKEVIQCLFSALFCEMMGAISREIPASETENDARGGLKQANYILRKFIGIMAKDNGMHRSVAYYADALCYSPKHFSKVIKQTCGRTPLEMINENAIEHIKYRLKHSDKSIKEISEEFEFPNQSFFGKYVKAHLGMSPAKYRDTVEE